MEDTMTATHTPGPWSIRTRETFIGAVVDHVTSPHGPIARMPNGSILMERQRDEVVDAANAHLIAAAPDLLAALEAIMRLVPDDIADKVAGHKARAAIAKATNGKA
jgi:hypothetical protein